MTKPNTLIEMMAEALAEDRAERIADQAANECIESAGVKGAGIDEYLISEVAIADDGYLFDCIEHLLWRGMAVRHSVDEDTVSVQLRVGA